MKPLLFALAVLLPLPAMASTLLADCDDTPYDVIVRNGGAERVVTLTKFGGEIEEWGPTVSFQIKDKKNPQPIVKPMSPDEEFCIWHGKIEVQRMNTGGANNAGVSLR